MPLVDSEFRPAWWLRNRHLQTLWASRARKRREVKIRWERIDTPDGDFFDVAWTPDTGGPLVQVMHGLEGSIRSGYASGIAAALSAAGFTVAVQHFRGCSGELNRLERTYHAGDTGDIGHFSAILRERYPQRPLAAIGYSLGGNQLLKWLGEQGGAAPVDCAVAVSVPFDLHASAEALQSGVSRLYQRYLVGELYEKVSNKFAGHDAPPVALHSVSPRSTFTEFDDRVTAPLHGFSGADEYYSRSSSRQYLRLIAAPTLLLQAADDPFLMPHGLPEAADLSDTVTLELSAAGGHVGFVAARFGMLPHYWLEDRIRTWLDTCLQLERRS